MTSATPVPERAPIIEAFKLLTKDPEFQALHQAVKTDQSADKSAEVELWIALLHRVFPTSNFKINMLDLEGPGLRIPYQVIEVLDITTRNNTGDESEEILIAVHIWRKCRKGSIFNDVAWRQKEVDNYWKSRGWCVREPDSVSVDEKRWTFESGVRVLDRETGTETLDIYWVLRKVFNVRHDGHANFDDQLLGADKFLSMVKRKMRAHEFEIVDWEYANIPAGRREGVKRRVAAVKARRGVA